MHKATISIPSQLPSSTIAVENGGRSGARWKALIFDVDGTLYHQAPVRRAMLRRLLRAYLTDPLQGFSTLRALRSYRHAQEELRHGPLAPGDVVAMQVQLAAQRVGLNADTMQALVTRWIEQEPLPFLASATRKGTVELLQAARKKGLRLASCSDYPAEGKLAAMGIADYFDVMVSAQHPKVQRFKPDPRSLELTIQELAIQKEEAIYIGDRSDVDAVAASRAGIQSIILSPGQDWTQVSEMLTQRGREVAVSSGGER